METPHQVVVSMTAQDCVAILVLIKVYKARSANVGLELPNDIISAERKIAGAVSRQVLGEELKGGR